MSSLKDSIANSNMQAGRQKVQEKPTNCGTKAADVLDEFLAGKHIVNPLNILKDLQLRWLHNAYQFTVLLHLLPFGRNL